MPKSQPPLQSRRSSTISSLKRTKPGNNRAAAAAAPAPRLEDVASISSLPPAGIRQDIVSLASYIRDHCFEDLPERAGMNSTQISATLRFRATLPPIVSLAHLYALSSSPTSTERELARLVAQGVVRKVSVPGRGKGGTAIGDGVVLVADWEDRLRQAESLSETTRNKYVDRLRSQPACPTTSTKDLSSEEVRALVTAGFLTTPAALSASVGDLFTSPSTSSLLRISSAGSSAPTGSVAAVGGIGAVHESGGSGSMLATSSTRNASNLRVEMLQAREMTFSLPNTGAHLKLLANARAHLILLIRQVSPKWRESTIDLLREKWNGVGSQYVSDKKRNRGEGNGLLVAKTRRWREFMGLEFDYVLAEALGSGVVELFDTGSVGSAVRMR